MSAHNKLACAQANLADHVGPAAPAETRAGRFAAVAGFGRRSRPYVMLLLSLLSAASATGQGVVGETRCGNPTCHGAALPATPADDPSWKPWKSARTQWLSPNIDRHSRAYRTLTTEDSKRIAGYMGIEATKSHEVPGLPRPAGGAGRRTASTR